MGKLVKKLTAYDVFIGILYHMNKQSVTHYDSGNVVDFLLDEREKYTILSGFTRNQLYRGLDILYEGRIMEQKKVSPTPFIRSINIDTVAASYDRFAKAKLFGKKGLKELKDLSRKFFKEFG